MTSPFVQVYLEADGDYDKIIVDRKLDLQLVARETAGDARFAKSSNLRNVLRNWKEVAISYEY